MRLIRFGAPGKERPGLLKEDRVVDLTRHFPKIPDIGPAFFSQGWPGRIAGLDDAGEPLQQRLGPPVADPSKIICLGKNYQEHAKEGGFETPTAPLLFAKAPSALTGPYDPILLPQSSLQVDWEVELALVVGRRGKRIPESEALTYMAGVTVMNDVSGRDVQFGESQWFRGKSMDTFAPLGPALVTLDEIDDLNNLGLRAYVNGQLMQDGNTGDMISGLSELMAFVSQDMTLMPGDLISTGTPAGVGIFRDPPVVLKCDDVVRCEIDAVGAIENRVVAAL